MWCPHCQADVATEVAADGQSLLCTACGGEVRKVFAPSLHPETRSARELLERWAAEDLLGEADVPLPPLPDAAPTADAPAASSASETPGERESPRPKSRPKLRIDSAHSTADVVSRAPPREPAPRSRQREHSSPPAPQVSLPAGYRQDGAHPPYAGPHFDLQPALPPAPGSGQNESLWGQMLAYLGVGVLTIGTVLVLWGHFGGVANYASTGWLVATGGQMLLFLGVVTLISGGMQQTTHEVSRRVEHIGQRILQIERSARELLSGPHYGRGAGPDHDAAPAGREDEPRENR